MNFYEQKAYEAGQAAAALMEKLEPGQMAHPDEWVSPSGGGLPEEERASLAEQGFAVRQSFQVWKRALSLPENLEIPPELGERLRRLQDRDTPEDEIEQLVKEAEEDALRRGVPLDDILPESVQPEDEFWLRGFEDKLRELRSK